MQYTITGEDYYGNEFELTLEPGLEGDSVELTVSDGEAGYAAFPVSFDATELRDALSFARAELAER